MFHTIIKLAVDQLMFAHKLLLDKVQRFQGMECLANVLPPGHSNTCNDAAKWVKHDVSSTSIAPPVCEANSSLLDVQDEQDHTKVPAIDQKENRLHGTSCHSDNVEFVDKYVAFEPPEKGRHSNDGSQGVSTTEMWPVGDGPEAGKGNVLGKVEECQAGCRNGNKNMMSVSLQSNVCERIPLKGENDGFHQPGHALSITNHTHGLLSEYTKAQSSRSAYHLELVGCYLHQMPVLSIMLNTKNHSSLYIYVFCGLLESCQRFVYVYTVSKDQQDAPPCFVGYTLLLPSLDQSCTGNFSFGKSGLQFTPDGQLLVLMSCIRIPFCRMQNIDCLCSVCKLGQCEDNSLKIVYVNLGYVSLITKLMPYGNGTVSCILICEPNYIIAIEDNRDLHIWKMVNSWSEISEQYVIPSFGNMSPILELGIMPKSSSLIIGHDGSGGFYLWDISKRTLLATFAAPGNIVFQILPVGFCSLQEGIIHAPVDDIDKKLREIGISDMSRKIDQDHFMRDDIGVWVLISSASIAEYQYDLRTKEHNPRWRLALLAKKRIVMGNILDTRITALDASGSYGFAGTNGGQLYLWELSSGRKLIGVGQSPVLLLMPNQVQWQ
ncbi:hypothetical protein PVAP13_2KG271216 [Panicum virgatum]|uniref:Uncharacterized protein n=1 Tax=Panicum virgatum TaxID=38727 RepID=A0A8T0W165_PANVG|nr:hypothetical protein PVAP13_2KG271216 [Panicum virgatum]